MKDRDFLLWLHQYLVDVCDESEYTDYMGKLRSIALATPKDRLTPNTAPSIEEIIKS